MELGPQVNLAKIIVEELVACGVRQFFLCAGNQSSPIAAAIANNSLASVEYHFDERAASFMALGYAKTMQRAAAVVCTSGTAVANLYPAVLEAQYSQTPLILLTADRPEELQDTGANQTLRQTNFFSDATRWQFEFAAPQADGVGVPLESTRSAVDFAVYRAQSHPAGPVHLNLRFRKPFFSDSPSLPPRGEIKQPLTQYSYSDPMLAQSEIRKVAKILQGAKRGIIAVGGLSPLADRQAIETLAAKLQWPIWASVLSGMRTNNFAGLSCSHWYLSSSDFAQEYQPDVVLQLGSEMPKPANAVLSYLENSSAKRVYVSEIATRQDPLHSVGMRVEIEPSVFSAAILEHVRPCPSEISEPLFKAENITRKVLDDHASTMDSSETLTELQVVSQVLSPLTAEQQVCIANSLPIRLADYAARVAAAEIVVNRGLSGIDGLLATASGAHIANSKQTVVLSGDLSFLYDMNTLAMIARKKLPIVIILLNNGGGQIFSSVSRTDLGPTFQELMCTPHGMEFEDIARWAKLHYEKPASPTEFAQCYQQALMDNRGVLIEVCVASDESAKTISKIKEQVAKEIANGN